MMRWTKADTSRVGMLAALRDLGIRMHVPSWDEVQGIQQDDKGVVMVTVLHWEVTETQFRVKFKRGGYAFRYFDAAGRPMRDLDNTLWMPDMVSPDHVSGKVETEQEALDRIEYEKMTYRVGSKSNPMLNYASTVRGVGSTAAMAAHWKV